MRHIQLVIYSDFSIVIFILHTSYYYFVGYLVILLIIYSGFSICSRGIAYDLINFVHFFYFLPVHPSASLFHFQKDHIYFEVWKMFIIVLVSCDGITQLSCFFIAVIFIIRLFLNFIVII